MSANPAPANEYHLLASTQCNTTKVGALFVELVRASCFVQMNTRCTARSLFLQSTANQISNQNRHVAPAPFLDLECILAHCIVYSNNSSAKVIIIYARSPFLFCFRAEVVLGKGRAFSSCSFPSFGAHYISNTLSPTTTPAPGYILLPPISFSYSINLRFYSICFYYTLFFSR